MEKTRERTTEQSVYTAKELAESAASVFGANVKAECVIVAFRLAKKDSATLPEAIGIVESFMKKEVI